MQNRDIYLMILGMTLVTYLPLSLIHISDALVENQKRENTHLPALQEELKKVNKKIEIGRAHV